MRKVKLTSVCRPKQWKTIPTTELRDVGYPVYGANGVIGYYDSYNHEQETVVITCRGATCGTVNLTHPRSYVTGNAMCLDNVDDSVDIKYLFYSMQAYDFTKVISGTAQPQITREGLEKVEFALHTLDMQRKIVCILDKTDTLIGKRRLQLEKLDELVKSRFIEMFGDLKINSKRWKMLGFKECAEIDTNMIHNFEGYENYPHVGIDSIEKGTGRLFGYRTIAEDGVTSGKYLFTEKHIIYSKIRPNLNKVALPKFAGLCSADAYPILVKSDICTKEYLGYTMRSDFFLDYILAFSNRTNLPKVNKKQVEGFSLPVPPLILQQQFTDFIRQTDKSKYYNFTSYKYCVLAAKLIRQEWMLCQTLSF